MVQLSIIPEVADITDAGAHQWNSELRCHGLPTSVTHLWFRQPDSTGVTKLLGRNSPRRNTTALEEQLIGLTLNARQHVGYWWGTRLR